MRVTAMLPGWRLCCSKREAQCSSMRWNRAIRQQCRQAAGRKQLLRTRDHWAHSLWCYVVLSYLTMALVMPRPTFAGVVHAVGGVGVAGEVGWGAGVAGGGGDAGEGVGGGEGVAGGEGVEGGTEGVPPPSDPVMVMSAQLLNSCRRIRCLG
jgi:hypothetical protein